MVRSARKLYRRLRSVLWRNRVEQELDEELRYHLGRLIDDYVASGMDPTDARYAALRDMGGIEQRKEECRDARGVALIENLARDFRFALRMVAKGRAFSAVVVVSLALGIGANTAIFTLMDAVMWRLLPVADPGGLFVVGRLDAGGIRPGFTYSQYRLLRDNSTVANLAGYATAPINVNVDGPPEPGAQGQLVTGDYFTLLGVEPVLGRTIGPEDDRESNGHPVAVISHGYWERRFARDPSVIGRTVRISALPFTIVGVTPAGFFGVDIGTSPDFFLPMMMQPTVMPAFENLLEEPIVNRSWVQAIARTRPGIDRAHAAAALDALYQTHPDNQRRDPQARTGPDRLDLAPATEVSALRRQFSRPLVVLLAMVGVMLLTACANTANLLLARAAARRPEFAIRLALGAGRHSLLRQLLVESALLAGMGGACGVLLARWVTDLLVAYISSGRTPVALDLTPNLRILTFTATVSMITGVVFGFAPAWRAARIDLVPVFKGTRTSAPWNLRPGRVLAIAQLALSLLLLVGAGLFVRSLQALSGGDDDGLRDQVVTLRVEPRGSDQRNIPGTSERLDRIYRELIQRVQRIPGVRVASLAQVTPTAPTPNAASLVRIPSGEDVRVPVVMVYPNYFATMGIRIMKGRDFSVGDLDQDAPGVCIVNESFARQVYPTEDPLGKTCATGRQPSVIAGLVQDSRYSNPTGATRPVIYQTFLQASTGRGQMVLHVRAGGPLADVVQRIREAVTTVDPTVPMFGAHTLGEEMAAALVQQRLLAMLSSVFGVLALTLACVGLYGLLAFTVAQRMSEMGLRMALGARRGDVMRLVVSEALILVTIGIAIGVAASVTVARLASSQISGLLFGLNATDAATIAAASGMLSIVAALAAYLPARRASRVDPMAVLRAE